jgi:hypothetical protein
MNRDHNNRVRAYDREHQLPALWAAHPECYWCGAAPPGAGMMALTSLESRP